jgi:hypothetical protein
MFRLNMPASRADTTQDQRNATREPGVSARAARHESGLRVPGVAAVVGLLSVLALGTGCASTLNLPKLARSVPVPAGLTYQSTDHSQTEHVGGDTQEVDVNYANPSLTCEELRAAWISALTEAKWHPVDDGSSATQIPLVDRRGNIILDLGFPGVHTCSAPRVTVQSN